MVPHKPDVVSKSLGTFRQSKINQSDCLNPSPVPGWSSETRTETEAQRLPSLRGWSVRSCTDCLSASQSTAYSTVQYDTIQYGTIRYDTIRYDTIHYTTLHYTTLHYTTLHYTTLHYTTLHYTTLHYTTLHYTTLHYTTLHYTTLNQQRNRILTSLP